MSGPASSSRSAVDERAIEGALDRVVDPCSKALGEPLGLREMGLVAEVEVDHPSGAVNVVLRLTSPCCAFGPMMADAARREIAGLPGVGSVSVAIDHAAAWTPGLIAGPASVRLAERRRRTIDLTGAQPYDWTTWKDVS